MKVRLGDIFEIGSGGTPPKSHPEYYGGDIPWVKTGDLKEEYLFSVEDYITEEGLDNSSAKMYQPGTVLIAMYGATIGATSILQFDACTNQACAAFKPCKDVIPEYLYYFLRSQRRKFINDGVGGAQPNISAGYLKKVAFEIRPIEEQKEIIDVLDKINSIIQIRQEEIQRLDELVRARFVELFGDPIRNEYGWKTLSLLDSLEKGRTVSYGIVQTGDDFENGVPVFRPIDIAAGHMPKREDLKKTDPLISAQYKRTLLKGNELLITVRGSVGETFQTTPEFEGCNVGRNIVPLVTEPNKINQRFLQELFAQDPIKRWLKGITKGIALQGLNMSEFKEMPVIMPPLEKQNSFVVFAKQVDKSKAQVQKALDETQLLFDSLMQEYFG